MIIAADIGGTNTRLALFDADPRSPVAIEVYASAAHDGLEPMVRMFLAKHPGRIDGAGFAVAGPVSGGVARTTNLPWPVRAESLAALLSLDDVALMNDLVANAYGLSELGVEDLATLQVGDPDLGGNAAVISAGTGLGEAGLYWDGARYHAFPSEGSHTDFAPRDELQVALYEYLARDGKHVSYERVCSGLALPEMYRFLRERIGLPEPAWLTNALAGGDAGAVIGRAAVERRDPVCVSTLDVMVAIYGAKAGNLALTLLATGGIYLGGGIAPKILSVLRAGTFLAAFADKGRFGEGLARVPVHVVLNDRTALLGAARAARGEEPRLPVV